VRIMLERPEEPALGLLLPIGPSVALAQQFLQLSQLTSRRLAPRIRGDGRQQVLQVALGVLVPPHLQGQLGAATLELQVAGARSEGSLEQQEDPLTLRAIRVLLLHDPGVPRPGGPILGPEVQKPLQRVGGLDQVLVGLGAASTVQEG